MLKVDGAMTGHRSGVSRLTIEVLVVNDRSDRSHRHAPCCTSAAPGGRSECFKAVNVSVTVCVYSMSGNQCLLDYDVGVLGLMDIV